MTSPRAAAWVAGKIAVRSYGIATAPFRPCPDFAIIGGKRCGTTSLYRYLEEHPAVLPLFPSAAHLPLASNQKGVHYFDNNYPRGRSWYKSFFPSGPARRWRQWRVGAPVIAGEASPYYLFHPLAPERAAEIIPDVLLVVLLRDPVERTWSHFREMKRNGVERLNFEEALKAEGTRTEGEEDRLRRDNRYVSFAHEHQSYLAQSEYARPLAAWLDRFPRDRLLVMRSEDFYLHPQDTFDRVLRFLGLGPWQLVSPRAWNASPRACMNPETRAGLVEHFTTHNLALAEMLGQSFGWDGK